MPIPDRNMLLRHLDETRLNIEKLLPEIDRNKEIYPGWTIRELLAHLTGWDDVTIESLQAHTAGRSPSVSAIHSFDKYNAQSVSSRKDLDYEHVLEEWRHARHGLRTLIEQLPDDKLSSPVIVPWGGKPTVTKLLDIFHDHDEEHTRDILEWLKNPDKPLLKDES